MGVLGFAMLYAIISFFKLMGALSKWNFWKNAGVPCQAVVVEIMEVQEIYKKKKGLTHFRYKVAVDYKGQEQITVYPLGIFEKTVHPNSENDVVVGKELTLLYDPKTGICEDNAMLKGEIKGHLGGLIASVVIAALCLLIVAAIS